VTTAIKERTQTALLSGRLFDPGGGRSLDDLVSLTWEQLTAADADSRCVICGEALVWNGAERVAECSSCGSRLE
jgi:hypothetical protein